MAAGARLRELLTRAIERRQSLLAARETNVARLFNGAHDGVPGLVIERYAKVLVVQLHIGKLDEEEPAIREAVTDVMNVVGAAVAYRKYFPKDRSSLAPRLDAANREPGPWIGAGPIDELTVFESGLRYLVRPHDGFATGLYLDHRERRKFVSENAHGRRVLNGFAYTCAYGVAAAAGKAVEVTNVDISKRYLEWGKRNVIENAFPLDQQRFICSDTIDYYRRAARQGRRYDLVILDPPTFSRVGRSGTVFSLPAQLEPLVMGAFGIMDAEGILLLTVNHHQTTTPVLRAIAVAAARSASRRVREIRDAPGATDFGHDPAASKGLIVWLD